MINPTSIQTVLGLLIPSIEAHGKSSRYPFVLGLSGLQGSGKSTWAANLKDGLSRRGYNTRVLSIDDLYQDHDDLIALRTRNPENKLLRTRGQPGTHDEELAQRFFSELRGGTSDVIRWPAYDKSLNSGQGGRIPEDQWELVPLDPPIQIFIFEGWCLGFRPLNDAVVSHKWSRALASRSEASEHMETTKGDIPTATLADHSIEDLLFINESLRRYYNTFLNPSRFDGFLHLDTDALENVYHWRIEQERALREHKAGMSDEEIVDFVRGYMPSYELFLGRLRTKGLFRGGGGQASRRHIRITLNSERKVTAITEL